MKSFLRHKKQKNKQKNNKKENGQYNSNFYADRSSESRVAIFSTFLVGICAFVLGVGLGVSGLLPFWSSKKYQGSTESKYVVKRDSSSVEYINFDQFWKVWDLVKNNYVEPEKINEKDLFEGAIKGMVRSVNDAATVYLTSEEYAEYKKQSSGQYEGVGIELGYNENGEIVVLNILKGAPAESAGIKNGDIIMKVDGNSVVNKSVEEVISMIRGQSGTVVSLSVISKGERTPHDIKITRGKIQASPIKWEDKGDGIVTISIHRFVDSDVYTWKNNWNSIVEEVRKIDPKVIIVDVRKNGGGYFDAGIYAAEEFLEKGKIVVGQKSRKEIQHYFYSQRDGAFKDKPIVILVDKYTASASEIFAGALRGNNRGYIIGEKTTGKATVQQLFELQDGSAVKVTTAYWVLPNGSVLSPDSPIIPDKEVGFDEEAYKKGEDKQMQEALEYAKGLTRQ